MNVAPYDFRRATRLAVELEQQLRNWLGSACNNITERLLPHLPYPVQFQLHSLDTARPDEALSKLPDSAWGCYVKLAERTRLSLLVFPRQAALALAAGMLGLVRAELPEDRALTPVEQSLMEFALQEMLSGLEETWPGAGPETLTMAAVEPRPRRSREFVPDQNVVSCEFGLTGPFGEQNWHWILPQPEFEEAVTRSNQPATAVLQEASQGHLESLAQQIPVELSVILGNVQLHVSQLARMRAGDLVILNQRVTEPLVACVAGEKKFLVWPGRVGPRQAFQIESLDEC